MRPWILALIAALIAIPAHAEVINIDNAELSRLRAAGVPLVDVRTAGEWQETGIVPESHLLTFFDERGEVDAEAFVARLLAIARPDQPVAVICRSGNRTRAVSKFLSEQVGYARVYNVEKGIRAWIGAQQPVVDAAQAQSTCAQARRC
ncbi:MAG: rhodanese-like domain-containing protein [Rhodocyclaceae bacterium]|nr:rhodanese-like domain-containing protein [Rhodocyclaceae bacterium]